MNLYVSLKGAEELSYLRVLDFPKPTGTTTPIELLARIPSEECGCPEELWNIEGIIALMHFEANGSSEVFLFCGDFEVNRRFESADLNELRSHMFRLVADFEYGT